MWKMFIQYMVLGFELTTFGTWVSSDNHYTRAPAPVQHNFYWNTLRLFLSKVSCSRFSMLLSFLSWVQSRPLLYNIVIFSIQLLLYNWQWPIDVRSNRSSSYTNVSFFNLFKLQRLTGNQLKHSDLNVTSHMNILTNQHSYIMLEFAHE